MPVESYDFISFAEDCINRHDEIGYRNSIARSYYGAYHHICSILKNNPTRTHKDLIDYLYDGAWRDNSHYNKSALKASSYMLNAMKAQRIRADYNLQETLTESDAKAAVASVKKLINKCLEMQKDNTP